MIAPPFPGPWGLRGPNDRGATDRAGRRRGDAAAWGWRGRVRLRQVAGEHAQHSLQGAGRYDPHHEESGARSVARRQSAAAGRERAAAPATRRTAVIRRILAAIRRWAIDPELMETLQ